MSFDTIGSLWRRPISRLIAKKVFSGLVTAWRLAAWPTRRSPDSVKATIEGVVRAPSLFSMTLACLPSITATQELVVPRSMPITLLMEPSCQKQDQTARAGAAPVPREMTGQPGMGLIARVPADGRDICSAADGHNRQSLPAPRNVRSSRRFSRDRFGKLSHRRSRVYRVAQDRR